MNLHEFIPVSKLCSFFQHTSDTLVLECISCLTSNPTNFSYISVVLSNIESLHALRYETDFISYLIDHFQLSDHSILDSLVPLDVRIKQSSSLDSFKSKLFEDNDKLCKFSDKCFDLNFQREIDNGAIYRHLKRGGFSYMTPRFIDSVQYKVDLDVDPVSASELILDKSLNLVSSRSVPISSSIQDALSAIHVMKS